MLSFRRLFLPWVIMLLFAFHKLNAQPIRNNTPDHYSIELKRLLALDAGHFATVIAQGQINPDSGMLMVCKFYGLNRLLPNNEGYDPNCTSPSFTMIGAGRTDQASKLLYTEKGINKFKVQLDLANYYLFRSGAEQSDLSAAKNHLDGAMALANAELQPQQAIQVSLLMGQYHLQSGHIAESMSEFNKAAAYYRRIKDRPALAITLLNYADAYPIPAPEKLALLNEGLKAARQSGSKILQIRLLSAISTVHFFTDRPASLKDLLQVLQLEKQAGYRHQQHVYNVLAYIKLQQTEYTSAMDCAKASVSAAQQTGDRAFLSLYNQRMGDTYMSLTKEQEALKWFQKSLDEPKDRETQIFWYKSFLSKVRILNHAGRYKEAASLMGQISTLYPPSSIFDQIHFLFISGQCFEGLNRIKDAEVNYERFLASAKVFPEEYMGQEFPDAYGNIARFYLKQRKYEVARRLTDKAFSISKLVRSPGGLAMSHRLYFTLDSIAGDYPSAIKNYQQFKLLDDSLLNMMQRQKYDELEVRYKTVEKDRDIKSLQQKGVAQNARIEQEALEKKFILGGVAALIILSALLYYQYRTKQKSNVQLQRQREEISRKNEALEHLVAEKEWLLKEVHHRVKNNLQTIVSLLEHQSDYLTSDALAAIQDSQHRVYAMSLIHQKLYLNKDVTNIQFADYARELTFYLRESFKTDKVLLFLVELAPIDLNVSRAIPLGLILNEAVTNAIKYAFPEKEGTIVVKGICQKDIYILTIADNGIGLPTDFDTLKLNSLGFKLMRGLCREVGAHFHAVDTEGTCITITLPVEQDHRF